jgi:hypothetical protein
LAFFNPFDELAGGDNRGWSGKVIDRPKELMSDDLVAHLPLVVHVASVAMPVNLLPEARVFVHLDLENMSRGIFTW